MIGKKGTVVLRDIVFMMLIMSGIFVFAGLFVSEMALNYDNTNMSSEWGSRGTNTVATSMFNKTNSDVKDLGDGVETNVVSLIGGFLTGVGDVLIMVATAPNTIGNMAAGSLNDMGVSTSATPIISKFIAGILWVIVLFTIYSAFLQGGKV